MTDSPKDTLPYTGGRGCVYRRVTHVQFLLLKCGLSFVPESDPRQLRAELKWGKLTHLTLSAVCISPKAVWDLSKNVQLAVPKCRYSTCPAETLGRSEICLRATKGE